MSTNINKIYCYPTKLQINFPEGLGEIRFLKEIDGFNYLSIKQSDDKIIDLPEEFEEVKLPENFLKEIRQEQYKMAETLRKDHQFKNMIYNDIELSASQMARQNMLGIILAQDGSATDLYWKDIQENSQTFAINDFKEILKIISNRDTKLYYIEAQVKKEVDLKLSSSSLQPFNLNSSWQNHEEVYSQ
jgi:hypothetical protein